jgi:HAD superfamily hydrolase (TIGR01509 family)
MKYWIFDLDGTLTIPKHNFIEIKDELNIPAEQDILSYLEKLGGDEKTIKYQQLDQIEKNVAKNTEINTGVIQFLTNLKKDHNSELAVLTRNTKENAMITLSAINLLDFFHESQILGRDNAKAKPNPDGIEKILSKWTCSASEVYMVGDYIYDLQAGRNAGTKTILINQEINRTWNSFYDHAFENFIKAYNYFFAVT